MAKNRKLKKVSWAPDGNLCQIRQFSSEDCPSKVGLRVDENLQFQHPQKQKLNIASNNLPLGFSRSSMKKSEKLVHIPVRRWKCPPKVNLNPSWVVASGEQSEEVYLQRQRELTVFEAVYPRLADIPHSPSGALCKDGRKPDDRTTPTIRTTPIEDDEVPASEACPKLPVVSVSQPPGFLNINQPVNPPQTPGTSIISSDGADVDAAASAALDALLKSNEIGSTVDTGILIDILNNPDMVSMLLNQPASASTKPQPKTTSEQVPTPATLLYPSTDVSSSPSVPGKWGIAQNTTQYPATTMQPAYAAETIALPLGNFGGLASFQSPILQVNKTYEVLARTLPIGEIKPCISPPLPPQVIDVNYYKNLINQHGIDNSVDLQDKVGQQQKSHGLSKNGRGVSNNTKPCVFHNTPGGCRNGLKCRFQHDMTEGPNAKRKKHGREYDLINQLS